MKRSLNASLERLYQLFTSDLSVSEIERLIKRDAPGVYDFYVRDLERPDQQQNPVLRGLTFISNLFLTFLRKLTPARRLLYAMVLFLFAYGYVNANWLFGGLAFLLLNVLLAFELADKLTAKDELEVAREIQMGLLPAVAPQHRDYDIASFAEAAREVGGDYYDFIVPEGDGERLLVTIGDVSGKGMAAALHMVQAHAILHNLAGRYPNPRDILTALDENMRTVLPRNAFLTIGMASLNGGGDIDFCRAGHMPLIHYGAEMRRCKAIAPAGIGVGLSANGRFAKELDQVRLTPQAGDLLLFYTDGIVEAMNATRQEYGQERLEGVLCAHASGSARQVLDAILTDLAQFRGAAPTADDLTLVVMKKR